MANPLTYGPFTQAGTLQGVVIVVGGRGDPCSVHLDDHGTTYVCRANRPLAKELAQHLFSTPLRVTGAGRWFREGDGQWIMRAFIIAEYAVLKNDSLVNIVARLRQISAKWKDREPDPIALLRTIRHGEEI